MTYIYFKIIKNLMDKLNLLDLVKSRHSCRQFTGDTIPDSIIEQIIEIASYAPSSWGGHPVEFITIRNKETLQKLGDCKAMGDGPLRHSDVAIVPIIDSTKLELWKEDASVASTYILLAAEYFGIGACWIHMDGRDGKHKSSSEEIKDLLGIPSKYKILNCVSLGIKKRTQKKKEIDYKAKIHKEKY